MTEVTYKKKEAERWKRRFERAGYDPMDTVDEKELLEINIQDEWDEGELDEGELDEGEFCFIPPLIWVDARRHTYHQIHMGDSPIVKEGEDEFKLSEDLIEAIEDMDSPSGEIPV